MKENKTVIRSTPTELTPRPLIEVQPSCGAQRENSHVRDDYSDTLLIVPGERRLHGQDPALPEQDAGD